MDTIIIVDSGGTRQRTVSRQQQFATIVDWGHVAKSCPAKSKGKGESEGEHKENGKGKGKGIRNVNEWGQTEHCNNAPLLSMSCGEKQPENAARKRNPQINGQFW